MGVGMKVGNRRVTAPVREDLDASDNTSSKIGEIDEGDLFEAEQGAYTQKAAKASHFREVCEQLLEDHKDRPKTRVVLQVVARLLGLTIARCMSNMILFFTGHVCLEARRDYAVLPPSAV